MNSINQSITQQINFNMNILIYNHMTDLWNKSSTKQFVLPYDGYIY